MSLTINAYQLRQAAEFAAPDYEKEEDQRETELTFERLPAGTFTDGDDRPAGLYCWYTDYPGEGCMLLDEVPPSFALPDPSPTAPVSSTEHSASSSNTGSAPALSAAPSPTPPGFVDPAKSSGQETGAADGGQDSFDAWRQS